jgi:hypothetical protein
MSMVKTTAVAACAIAAAAAGLRAQTRNRFADPGQQCCRFRQCHIHTSCSHRHGLARGMSNGRVVLQVKCSRGCKCVRLRGHEHMGAGAQLPDMAGHAGKSLWTDGVSTAWKNITTGATGALALVQTGSEISFDIVPAVIPQKTAANVFTGLNTFGFGIQLSPQTAPASPDNGRIWYDSTLHKFRCHQNGVTTDCISSGSMARTIVAGTGIVVTDGDGVNGNPTIAASGDLLNLTTPQSPSTALMGPASGDAAPPVFRALTETDLPAGAALRSATNTFAALNTFNNGIRLAPQTAPGAPENGHVWYDDAAGRFRARENGQTVDLRGASGLADPGASGIIKRTALNTTAPAVAGVDYIASQIIAGNPSAAIAASSTQYLSLAGASANASENVKQTPIARAGTFSSLHMRISSAQPGTGSLVCSLRKNGADTPLSVTFDAGDPIGTVKANTSQSVSIAAGDLVAIGCVNSAASTSGNISGMSLVFQ